MVYLPLAFHVISGDLVGFYSRPTLTPPPPSPLSFSSLTLLKIQERKLIFPAERALIKELQKLAGVGKHYRVREKERDADLCSSYRPSLRENPCYKRFSKSISSTANKFKALSNASWREVNLVPEERFGIHY